MKLFRRSAPIAQPRSVQNPRPTPNPTKAQPPRVGHTGIDAFVLREAPPVTLKANTRGYDLTYRGGKVLKNPVFQPIYLGDYWKTEKGAADRKYNDGFVKEVVTSKHQDLLAQYGVGKGGSQPSVVVNGAPTRVTQADVIALVQKQLSSGAVKPGPETVHMVVLPPGAVLDAGGGVDSTKGLGGFHGSYVDASGKNVYFGVVAYSEGRNGIDFNGNARDNLTIVESHEFDEAATDPDVGNGKLGWYNSRYGEIGDLAVNSGLVPLDQAHVRDEHGYEVQVEWSNKDHKFIG